MTKKLPAKVTFSITLPYPGVARGSIPLRTANTLTGDMPEWLGRVLQKLGR